MSLFRRKATMKRALSPLTDPSTGEVLPERENPGYYPGFSTMDQQKSWEPATRLLVKKRLQTPGPLQFFHEDEAQTMQAVCDRVLPQDDRVPERRIPILTVIDQRLHQDRIDGYRYEDMPSDQDAYRIAAAAFRQMANDLHGRPFHELQWYQQEALLVQVKDGSPQAAEDLWHRMNVKRFWTMLVSDCCSAYYAHPWAWDEIGFGGPAYPRGYMRLEEGEPEPWEVQEERYEWTAPMGTLSDEKDKSK